MPKCHKDKNNIRKKKEPTPFRHKTLVLHGYAQYGTFLSCKFCKRFLSNEDAARSHVKNCSKKPPSSPKPTIKFKELPRYICDICNLDFSRATNLKAHMRSHVQYEKKENSEEKKSSEEKKNSCHETT